MFKILIADDEPHQLKRLKRIIDNSRLPFKVCGIASDGSQAIELCHQLVPDIVISDIRMPFCDGLTLAESLKREQPEMPIILISAFQDFEYAHRALQLGIMDYLMKPMDESRIMEVLKKAEKVLTESRENFLRKTLFITSGESENSGAKVDQALESMRPYRLALYMNQPDNSPRLSHQWMVSKRADPAYCLELDTNKDGSRLFLFSGEAREGGDFLAEKGIRSGYLLLSQENPPYNDWKTVCETMSKGLWENCIWGGSGILELSDEPMRQNHSTFFCINDELMLREILRNGKIEDFCSAIQHIIEQAYLRKIPLINLIDGLRTLSHLYISHASFRLSVTSSQFLQIIENTIRELPQFGFYPDQIIKKLITHFKDAVSLTTEQSSIEWLKSYVDKNYKEQIDTTSLADMAGLPASEIAAAFRKETGTSLSKYMITLRINAAKELLVHGSFLQIKEIAWEVGYEDPLYFSRIFHKRTGYYPTEYREKYIKNDREPDNSD